MEVFPSLPVEMQQEILAFLDVSDLSALSRTSKKVRNSTLATLYRNISIIWSDRYYSHIHADVPTPMPTLVLRSLLENPKLGPLVRNLRLGGSNFTYQFDPETQVVAKSIKYRQAAAGCLPDHLFEGALKDFEPEEQKLWRTLMKERCLDTTIALLLLHCTRLYHLDADAGLLAGFDALPLAIQHIFHQTPTTKIDTTPRSMCNLRKLDLRYQWEDDKRAWNSPGEWKFGMKLFLSFLRFPTLQECNVDRLAPKLTIAPSPYDPERDTWEEEFWEDMPDPALGPPLACQLTELRLGKTLVRPKLLEALLRHTPNLSHLIYDYHANGYPRFRDHGYPGGLDCADLAQALGHLRHSLQHFAIRVRPIYHYDDGGVWVARMDWLTGALGSTLKDFQKLKHVDIAPVILFGADDKEARSAKKLADVLPESLETLSIHDILFLEDEVEYDISEQPQDMSKYWWSEDETVDLFTQFLYSQPISFPKFKELKLDMKTRDWHWNPQGNPRIRWAKAYSEQILGLCMENGVDGEVTRIEGNIEWSLMVVRVESTQKMKAKRESQDHTRTFL